MFRALDNLALKKTVSQTVAPRNTPWVVILTCRFLVAKTLQDISAEMRSHFWPCGTAAMRSQDARTLYRYMHVQELDVYANLCTALSPPLVDD